MTGKAERLQRVARVRALQKRQALAAEARAATDLEQLRQMHQRIESLRRAYVPIADKDAAFSLKAMTHQYERLGKALAQTEDRTVRAEARLDDARSVTLAAHMRKRAAEELADRAETAEAREAELRRERATVPRRTIREA